MASPTVKTAPMNAHATTQVTVVTLLFQKHFMGKEMEGVAYRGGLDMEW